ncbi:aminobenzoyl-glutamate utilization protein B [Leeuwenhoekiella aestuarii]|uniref:Aminobenzoyl-glutamate utilization protein B n=1 Tax=Leeuwenhoekiella aestuarii TaxID=2249426 RepID=A0A4Q0P0W9_9FLAO|nr:amidohydrolase [Leeuwenhoekiella aestuarii]RXG17889.1 aminobenzoyl-glutamate utilization protein B [Leeuwenhoekiella aestuarii]RXG19218.1 aminobenzoyl-glutamate utilization protein B [Leeuwenhoekiella aestuarii]
MKKITLLLSILMISGLVSAQKIQEKIISELDQDADKYGAVAHKIWSFAEMGYQEEQSVALLQETLKNEGFTIEDGVAGMPTAFIASYGSGKPVIAVLGEYDALPGLSQQAVTQKESAGGVAGHACGHHLFGTASAAAAISIKKYLVESDKSGTIRFYGCPAEEGGSGKVYLTRAGLFDDVDAALNWHPGNSNGADPGAALANKSAKFRFHGIAAHAAGAPEKGRSALDGVEAMNYMVNMMREHVPEDARIHYVITDGGKAPNVVPDFAEVYYYARHTTRGVVIEIFDRMVKAAEGAAMGTGTTMDYEMIGGTHELLPNLTLQKLMYSNLKEVGGYTYTAEEREFAEEISKTLGNKLDTRNVEGISDYNPNPEAGGSTDVGDVSFKVPTVGLYTATWVPGTPAHSWQAVAAGGMSIGEKGMMIAAKTIAKTGMDLLNDPSILKEAKKEFIEKRGTDFEYIPLLGDREPALDYRN